MATLVALLGAMFVVMGQAKAQDPYVALNLVVDFPEDSDDTIAAGTSTNVRLRLMATDLSSRIVSDPADAEIGDWASVSYDFAYGDTQGGAANTNIATSLTYLRASDGLILTAGTETGIVLSNGTQALRALPSDPVAATAEDSTAHIAEISAENLKVIVPAGVDDGSAVVSASVVAGVTITYRQYVADDGGTDNDDYPDVGADSTAKSLYIPLNRDTDDDGNVDSDDEVGGELGMLTAANSSRNGSATLNIGNVDEVDSIRFGRSSPKRGSTDPGTTEPAFVSTAGGTTEFTLHVFNANEKPSQINSISSIVVSTTSGTFSSDHSPDKDLNSGGQCGGASTTCELEPSRGATAALPKTGLRFLLAAPTRSGTADIRVVVISRAGNVLIDEDQIVTFHGPAAMLEAGEASGTVFHHDVVGKAKGGADKRSGQDGDTGTVESPNGDRDSGANLRDQISFSVKAVDNGGTTVVTPKLSAKITGPNGKAVSSDAFAITQSGDLSDTAHLDIDVAASKKLAMGEHSIKFSAGALSGTSSFTVVGPAYNVEIMDEDADENGKINVMVKVNADEEGTPVADGTTVTVEAADLRGDGDRVIHLTSSDGKTKDGVANATFIEIGPGRAAIIAMADGETAVARVTSEYGAEEPEAMPEEEAGLSCLSSLSGFSTWTCDVEASASEIFDWISSRGATALHLNSNRMWVRYSVVDGAMVPGSSDFMVTKSDILYISN